MNDYSLVFQKEMATMTSGQEHQFTGRLNSSNYAKNNTLSSVEHFKEALKEGTALWEIPFDLDQYDEDNDTEEFSSDDEEFESIEEVKLGPKKSVKYYMQKEQQKYPI